MLRAPFAIPGNKVGSPSSPTTPIVNQGGYDVLIGNLGFRLANDTNFPYTRGSDKLTSQKITTSAEPGEQNLSDLPWLRSQSSFHGGAGQLNLESGFTAFQYQQEEIQHVRFDTSLNADVWTPGKVKRLPDVQRTAMATTPSEMIAATIGGVDYAIVGGAGGLWQLSWPSGPDSLPTLTSIDLTSATYGGASNCTISSLCTDGINYYGVLQMTAAGSTAGILTYIISGSVNSTAAPTALYEVPNYTTFTPRTNLCTNPSGETGTSGWSVETNSTVAVSTTQHQTRAQALKVTATATPPPIFGGIHFQFTAVVGKTYTCSAYVYLDSSMISAVFTGAQDTVGVFGSSTTTKNSWTRLSVTFTAQTTTPSFALWAHGDFVSPQFYYVDSVLIEQAGGTGTYFDGATAADAQYTYSWSGTADASTSVATPGVSPMQAPGVCGWVKERLIAAVANSVYELPPNVTSHSALPTAKYTRPGGTWVWAAVSESPNGVLVAGAGGNQSSILELTLDTSGNTPTLGGGSSVAMLPVGESVQAMYSAQGSFLAIGTTKGLRIGTFDTYSGTLTYGPPTWDNAQPVLCAAARDRFIYAGYSNSQADGTSGVARIDLGTQTDQAGRQAWSPDLKPSTAVTGTGTTYAVAVLPVSQRVVFTTPDGLFVEGNGPGTDGDAWIRTSRIRFGTTEPKLFKLGQIRGSLNMAQVQVTAIAPYNTAQNCGTFGFTTTDPGEFRLMDGTWEWIQMKYTMLGSSCEINSYQVKAIPQPHRQRLIQFTVNCFRNETDKLGMEITDPMAPHDRLTALEAIEQGGGEVQLVEFTNTGPLVYKIVIEDLQFTEFSRPNVEDDFGGYITIKLRTTES